MPACDTSGDSVVADTCQNALNSTTDAEVIAQLSRDVHVLNVALTDLSKGIDTRNQKIFELEKEKKESIPKSCIKELIENAFKDGTIPIPNDFGRVVEVTCSNITFSAKSGIHFDVTFVDAKGSLLLLFQLSPTPREFVNIKKYFPNFHMGYTKITPPKKWVKKKLATDEVNKDSYPPSGNPS
jgi:hypothetical protein